MALYDNLFVNEHGDAIRIQPHNDIPRRIVIAFNTVVAKGAGITLMQKEGAPSYPQTVSANAVFAGVPIRGGRQSRNLAAPMSEANDFLSRPFAPAGPARSLPAAQVAARRGDEIRFARTVPGLEQGFQWAPPRSRLDRRLRGERIESGMASAARTQTRLRCGADADSFETPMTAHDNLAHALD